jgi:hypothetical protein
MCTKATASIKSNMTTIARAIAHPGKVLSQFPILLVSIKSFSHTLPTCIKAGG